MGSDKDRIEILHDHFKETFEDIHYYLKLRDRSTLYILILLIIFLIQIYSPADWNMAISNLFKAKTGLTETIDLSFLNTVVWFVLFGLLIRYFQTVIHIDRQYKYIHKLEEYINPLFSGDIYKRESSAYKKVLKLLLSMRR